MKELEKSNPEKVQISVQRQYEKTAVIGSLSPKKGQKCYQMNLVTGEISEVQYVGSPSYHPTPESLAPGIIVKRVNILPKCMYVCALNKEAAQKKIFQHPDRMATVLKGE